MNVIVTRMWLSCDYNDATTLAAFDQRFPRTLEREWATIVHEDTVSLHDVLDGMIFDACMSHIQGDVPDAVAVDTFTNGSWTIGTGGQHEGDYYVKVKNGNGDVLDWEFGPSDAKMRVHVCWALRVVRT